MFWNRYKIDPIDGQDLGFERTYWTSWWEKKLCPRMQEVSDAVKSVQCDEPFIIPLQASLNLEVSKLESGDVFIGFLCRTQNKEVNKYKTMQMNPTEWGELVRQRKDISREITVRKNQVKSERIDVVHQAARQNEVIGHFFELSSAEDDGASYFQEDTACYYTHANAVEAGKSYIEEVLHADMQDFKIRMKIKTKKVPAPSTMDCVTVAHQVMFNWFLDHRDPELKKSEKWVTTVTEILKNDISAVDLSYLVKCMLQEMCLSTAGVLNYAKASVYYCDTKVAGSMYQFVSSCRLTDFPSLSYLAEELLQNEKGEKITHHPEHMKRVLRKRNEKGEQGPPSKSAKHE